MGAVATFHMSIFGGHYILFLRLTKNPSTVRSGVLPPTLRPNMSVQLQEKVCILNFIKIIMPAKNGHCHIRAARAVQLYSCAQNRPSAASETPGRAHPGASGPFPPATHTLGTLWPAGLAGGDLWWSPAAVPQAKDAISVWLSSGLRESCG